MAKTIKGLDEETENYVINGAMAGEDVVVTAEQGDELQLLYEGADPRKIYSELLSDQDPSIHDEEPTSMVYVEPWGEETGVAKLVYRKNVGRDPRGIEETFPEKGEMYIDIIAREPEDIVDSMHFYTDFEEMSLVEEDPRDYLEKCEGFPGVDFNFRGIENPGDEKPLVKVAEEELGFNMDEPVYGWRPSNIKDESVPTYHIHQNDPSRSVSVVPEILIGGDLG